LKTYHFYESEPLSHSFIDRMLEATKTLAFCVTLACAVAGILVGLAIAALYMPLVPLHMVKLAICLVMLQTYVVGRAAYLVHCKYKGVTA